MEKIECVLVVLNKEFLQKTIESLNFDKVNLNSILMDGSEEEFFRVSENDIPVSSFERIEEIAEKYRNCIWLISGCKKDSDIRRIKKFLTALGLERKNIVDFESYQLTAQTWTANYNHVEKNGADFFATGDKYFRDALDLKLIPCVHRDKNSALGGVNLAHAEQNLRQSYYIAKNIFAHIKPGTVKFVLIGLSPDYFYRDTAENSFDFQILRSQKNFQEIQSDLNFDEIKKEYDRAFSVQSVFDWEENLSDISQDFGEKNAQILRDYINLCVDNGATPIGVIFPVAPIVRKFCSNKALTSFREILHQIEGEGKFVCIDMSDLKLDYRCFCDVLHFNLKGTMFVNSLLAMKLCINNLIPAESFEEMSYRYLNRLAWVAGKDEYNMFLEKVFNASVKKIRRKDKVKIGFVVRGSAEWCGDDLYNLFVNDERFEVTVFSFLELGRSQDKAFVKDFWHGIEQFKQRGLNVVALDNIDAPVSEQDIFIFLSPYFDMMPLSLQPESLTLKTLITHSYYGFTAVNRPKIGYSITIFNICWKSFWSSKIELEAFRENNIVGMPGSVLSGYPRADLFFKSGIKSQFNWKMIQPDAKKIIYAPHWSINDGVKHATFQWNYKFMYEFAKTHPEMSFVYKPHPLLSSSVIREKVFSSSEEYEEYLQKWNALPNAQVYTGAYYQDVFMSSDGMILDSISFIVEYQFVNKPMIFLNREGDVTRKFNKIGEEILDASYLVDGKDFDAIAEMMQRVFIEGDDYKAEARKKVFDKYLNYPKYNGMLASEFIYKSIADELKEEKKW